MSKKVIGIDLGTTFSCVAVYENGRVEVIANIHGQRITPSVVAFTDTEVFVGEAAKNQITKNLSNTIFDVKRLIGHRFKDQSVQEDKELWPFSVVDDCGRPKINIKSLGKFQTIFPEAISSMVIGEMKKIAEKHLGYIVSDAVITVPAYFNDSQRQATKDAAKIAGLKVLQLINEPTASAIAFGFQKKIVEKKTILIYDLGGGTFDVSIVSIENGKFDVKAVGGNTHLGGVDFDTRMVKHFIDKFNIMHQVDISSDKLAVQKLRIECEKAKKILSESTIANLEITNLYKGIDFEASIRRAIFEDLNKNLFKSTLEHVEKALKDAKLEKNEIDEIILVGGSTRIPKIQRLLRKFFNGIPLNHSINVEEAVGMGAAVVAAIVSGVIHNIKFTDVTSLSLGVEIIGQIMSTVIPRNTIIPTKMTKEYTTVFDNQKSIIEKVYEGENKVTKYNDLLGSFELCGIPPMPGGVPKVDVTFEIDISGTFTVTAVERSTGNRNQITIVDDRGLLTKDDIERIIADTERFRLQQEAQRELNIEINSFINVMLKAKSSHSNNYMIAQKCNEIMAWLDKNPYTSEEEFKKQMKEFDETTSSINSNTGGQLIATSLELCRICDDARKNCVLNCGHMFCMVCAERAIRCYVCRSEITFKIQVFD